MGSSANRVVNDPRLTVGMACYDDFDGVWFSVKALRMYHGDVADMEIVVVDNNPDSAHGREVKRFVESTPRARYVPFGECRGTAQPRNRVFEVASGDYVVCIDCHVLLEPGSLRKLVDYLDANPDCRDLLQGPLVGDRGRVIGTHQELTWRRQALGVWATDDRGIDPDGTPFEIPQQGMGCFACRREAWVGFHPGFRGFGGCETYVAESYRRRGDRVLCLPFLRWHHRFPRPGGVPHSVSATDQLQNYLLTARALGWDEDEVRERYLHDVDPALRAALDRGRTEPDSCLHEDLAVEVDFQRTMGEGRVTSMYGELRVSCTRCGRRFDLLGGSNHIALDP